MNNNDQETISTVKRANVSQRLLKGMTPEQAEAYKAAYVRARRVLTKINDYAASEIKTKNLAMDNPTAFESPNWQYLVAWWAGYRTAMRITQDLTRT